VIPPLCSPGASGYRFAVPTARYLRKLAEREREALRRETLHRLTRIEVLEQAAEELERRERLHQRVQDSTVPSMDTQAHALATSKGRSESALAKAANKRGMTIRALAAELGVRHSMLTMAAAGDRPIKRSIADKIADRIGFAATAAHWPGGITDDTDRP
jgi:hypothetical protein